MLDKPLDEVTEAGIQELVDESVFESKEIEYKEFLNPSDDSDHKTKLLAEVTSFANTRGGDLIVGMRAQPRQCSLNHRLLAVRL